MIGISDLYRFDQSLMGSIVVLGADSQFSQLMIGQLYFLMAVFLMHSAKKVSLEKIFLSNLGLIYLCLNVYTLYVIRHVRKLLDMVRILR